MWSKNLVPSRCALNVEPVALVTISVVFGHLPAKNTTGGGPAPGPMSGIQGSVSTCAMC